MYQDNLYNLIQAQECHRMDTPPLLQWMVTQRDFTDISPRISTGFKETQLIRGPGSGHHVIS